MGSVLLPDLWHTCRHARAVPCTAQRPLVAPSWGCPVSSRCSRLPCRATLLSDQQAGQVYSAALTKWPASADEDDSQEPSDLEKTRQRLNRLMDSQSMTGEELRSLLVSKWGRSYDARLQTRNGRTYFQVMWKYLEQVSFPLSEAEYMAQLDAVAELLTMWGLVSTVRDGILRSSARGPGYTGGGGARAVSIPLEIRA